MCLLLAKETMQIPPKMQNCARKEMKVNSPRDLNAYCKLKNTITQHGAIKYHLHQIISKYKN